MHCIFFAVLMNEAETGKANITFKKSSNQERTINYGQ